MVLFRKQLEVVNVMEIRLAKEKDIPKMREIFDYGREIQLESGNLNQWADGYPSDELIQEDLAVDAVHVLMGGDEMLGVMSLFTEADPTYKEIEGKWLNDEPYATIHRIATSGKVKGSGQKLIKWAQDRFENIRIDTHEDNEQMKYIVQKLGFKYCGIIYLENGDPRNAYHYKKEDISKKI